MEEVKKNPNSLVFTGLTPCVGLLFERELSLCLVAVILFLPVCFVVVVSKHTVWCPPKALCA